MTLNAKRLRHAFAIFNKKAASNVRGRGLAWLVVLVTSGTKMTGDQSRLLKVGDRVWWNADKNDQGTITEKNWAGVTVKWDNRGEQSILHNDMVQVERVPVKG
jgi:hypothetical protein